MRTYCPIGCKTSAEMNDRSTALLLIAIALAGAIVVALVIAAYVNRQHGPRID